MQSVGERRTKICFPFCGDLVGGSHISVLGLLRNLDRRRFDPVVLVEAPEGEIARLMRGADVDIATAGPLPALRHGERAGLRHAIGIARASGALARLLRERAIDIVHSNDGRTHAIWALPAKLAGAKLVWHHRGAPDARGLRFVAPRIADAVVSVSGFALGKAGMRSRRARVIHSPFDTDVRVDREALHAALLDELGCSEGTRLIGFFGVLISRKRPLLFVEAIAALRRRAPDLPVRGLVFGTPLEIDEAMVRAHAERHGVADAIQLMGFRYPGADWIAACDLLMVPAVDEPFGRTLIESMLVGTPIVATRSGGNIEALQDGRLGTLVAPEDPNALAAGALELLRDENRSSALAAAARTHASSHFGEDRHAEAVMALYDELVPRAAPGNRERWSTASASVPQP
ncbi:glycosyltransferase family 4 protein [Sphingomonas sp. JC676]|uniref:glycosyltransferase family 4 protein n=1 Tax=Sphingomonas sp. JC676 TaxID=2768065 RepID=UPI0016581407|nr:glycosyltransferase family 4 protein [Sphingomonas sp. JC676]MBC9031177.1 glycosyltransferase family 4 protein [Sphingomonas sp. JC676]